MHSQDIWTDKRVELFDPAYFENKRILDIGCNVGYIDIIIGEQLHPEFILGIDLDPMLISNAKSILAERMFLQSQSKETLPSSCLSLHTNPQLHYHSPLFQYPHNIFFKVENFMTDPHFGRSYDTILCLSTIKWIHLNYGDDGVLSFFDKVHDLLVLNGFFLFEPQPWTSYKRKSTINEHVSSIYQSIKIRPSSFPQILEEKGFELMDTLSPQYDPQDSFSKRFIYIYKKVK